MMMFSLKLAAFGPFCVLSFAIIAAVERTATNSRQMRRDAIGGEAPFKENYALLKKLSEMCMMQMT